MPRAGGNGTKAALRPRLLAVEIGPVDSNDEARFALRDPDRISATVHVPFASALAASLMNGKRTLAEIQTDFQRTQGVPLALEQLIDLVAQLDEACLLEGPRYRARRAEAEGAYLASPVRPAALAGSAYAAEPETLVKELDGYFAAAGRPRVAEPGDARRLRGIISPHIDPYRGGPAYAHAYERVRTRGTDELFVILGTAHQAMDNLVCACRKDFETPLGRVQTDRRYLDRLAEHLGSSLAGRQTDPFADALAHRTEHSIEFQVLFLQHVLGPGRTLRIAPVLVGSFADFIGEDLPPEETPEFQALVTALAAAEDSQEGGVFYISGADLAHVGIRFGDAWPFGARRQRDQEEDDRKLLEAVCRGDAAGLFRHVADQGDCRRICGLSSMYLLLHAVGPCRGEVLTYQQAVEPNQSACVSFASVALYRSGA